MAGKCLESVSPPPERRTLSPSYPASSTAPKEAEGKNQQKKEIGIKEIQVGDKTLIEAVV